MKLLIPCGLAVLMWTSAAATSSAQLPRFPACYDLELGKWSPPFKGYDSVYAMPPTRVLLDTTRVTAQPLGVFQLSTAAGAMPSIHDFSTWAPLGRDSLRLIWGNGFTGVQAQLRAGSGTLTGFAQTFSDVVDGRPQETAPIVAKPVSCAAPLRKEARHSYRFARGIGFPTADSLLVGEPLPASLAVETATTRSYRILTTPAAPFADATRVNARVSSDGKVYEIEVWFPADAEYREILARLIAITGAPSVQQDRLGNGYLVRGAVWVSRTISINLDGVYDPTVATFTGPAAGK